MNNIIDAIEFRRSIRKFKATEIPKEIILEILIVD